MAKVLTEITQFGPDTDRKVRRLREFKHEGDDITHRIYQALNSTFVTPLDREDIRTLASALDDFVDGLEEVGKRLWLYRMGEPTESMRLFIRILVEQAQLLADNMPHLERPDKRAPDLQRCILELHRLENEADEILNQVLAALYEGVSEVPQLVKAIRWGEITIWLKTQPTRARTSGIRSKGSSASMPSTELLVVVLIVVLGLGFDFINGFHDTANAIATSVATRVLSPGQAVLLAAVMNVLGALSGTAVATTVGKGIIPTDIASQQLVVASLLSAITWNLVTWRLGIPSSSSHALVFSIVGAGTASAGLDAIQVSGVSKVLKGMVYSPLLGFLGAFLILLGLLWLVAKRRPRTVNYVFGKLQIASAAFMAYSHGSNDAQKTMGVISLSLASYYGWSGSEWNVPLWVILAASAAMGLGTATGGWRIVRTMGLKVVELRPIDGFAAETAAASIIEVASRLGIPVSTTHVISSAILGVGATRRASAVRWGVAGRIVTAWVVTVPICVTLGWLFYHSLHVITGVR